MSKMIDTASFAPNLRDRAIRLEQKSILISVLAGSDQEGDLSEPTNCEGLGRIRHFKHETAKNWPINPLPTVPAARALGIDLQIDSMNAQVFQNAACPWRCWYCFVPYNLLSANQSRSKWMTAAELVDLYESEARPPRLIDLSGGSPDLIPEWSIWMMDALEAAGLSETTYLWSDDNLSTTYLFDKLTKEQLRRLQTYPNYGRVCCFKGYDEESFSFNTGARKHDFGNQLSIMSKLLGLDIDIYGYITLTGPNNHNLASKMARFFDQLQSLHRNLPLRIVPLRIGVYGPVEHRLNDARLRSLEVQEDAIACWNNEILARFSPRERELPICDVSLNTDLGAKAC